MESVTLLVVDGPQADSDLESASRSCVDTVDVLAWGGAGTAVTQSARLLDGRVRDTLSTNALMERAVPRARERFVRFSAEWPMRPLPGGISFRRMFQSDGCSLWWFTELAQKNPGTRPTFARLCRVEALRLALADRKYQMVVLVSRDRDQVRVLTRVCEQCDVPSIAPLPLRQSDLGFTKLMLGRLKRASLDALAAVLTRHRRLPLVPPAQSGRRRLAFHTWYPTQWRPWHGRLRDRYYVNVVDQVRSTTPWQAYYVCTLPAPTLAQFRMNLARAADAVANDPDGYAFLEAACPVRDVLRLYLDLRAAARYWWLECTSRAFRNSFDWDGVDIFPIARHDIRITMIRDAPYFQLLAQRMRRFVAAARPTDLVTSLETYGYGRAVAWGAKSAPVAPRLIGFQHSPINRNQLVHRFMPDEVGERSEAMWLDHVPLPDHYLLHGDLARTILRSSGIAAHQMTVCGAPRFDDLAAFARARRERFDTLRQPWASTRSECLVVVPLVIWPQLTTALIDLCAQALGDRADTVIVFKPHPLHRSAALEVAALPPGRARVMTSDGDLTNLQSAADIMVGAFGTSDVEALAIGCPVVRVRLEDFDLSPTSEFPGMTREVGSPAELRRAVDDLAGCEPDPLLDRFIEQVFFRLDGHASDRVVAALGSLESTAS